MEKHARDGMGDALVLVVVLGEWTWPRPRARTRERERAKRDFVWGSIKKGDARPDRDFAVYSLFWTWAVLMVRFCTSTAGATVDTNNDEEDRKIK